MENYPLLMFFQTLTLKYGGNAKKDTHGLLQYKAEIKAHDVLNALTNYKQVFLSRLSFTTLIN